MKKILIFFALCSVSVGLSAGFFETRKAFALYDKGEYDQARGLLEKMQTDCPEDPEVNFNLGVVQYKLGDLDDACLNFIRAAENFGAKNKPQRQVSALSNAGKVRYQGVGKSLTDRKWGEEKIPEEEIKGYVGTLQQVREHYKSALEIAPEDADIKLADRSAEELIQKLMAKNESQKQDPQQKGDDQQDGDNKEKGDQPQQQGDDDKKQEGKDKDDEQKSGDSEKDQQGQQPQSGDDDKQNSQDEDKQSQEQQQQGEDEKQQEQPQEEQQEQGGQPAGAQQEEAHDDKGDSMEERGRLALLEQNQENEKRAQRQMMEQKMKSAGAGRLPGQKNW
ncbi:tetratricopeptide repeat protein [bacterium]|nr:tetratricopeptide repeat protein [bacterium]